MIKSYLHSHRNVGTKLVDLSCQQYSKDGTVSLDNPFHTRLPSKLSVLKRYIVRRPYLERVLPSDAPLLPESIDENVMAA